jgi:hypothetical protein
MWCIYAGPRNKTRLMDTRDICGQSYSVYPYLLKEKCLRQDEGLSDCRWSPSLDFLLVSCCFFLVQFFFIFFSSFFVIPRFASRSVISPLYSTIDGSLSVSSLMYSLLFLTLLNQDCYGSFCDRVWLLIRKLTNTNPLTHNPAYFDLKKSGRSAVSRCYQGHSCQSSSLIVTRQLPSKNIHFIGPMNNIAHKNVERIWYPAYVQLYSTKPNKNANLLLVHI